MELKAPHVEGWTEERYWQFLRSGLRKMWNKYPVKYEALKKARRLIPEERRPSKRVKYEYQCAECKNWFINKKIKKKLTMVVDHIKPCGKLTFYTLPQFTRNLLCDLEEVQVLCRWCHDIKTYMERYGAAKKEAIFQKKASKFLERSILEQKSFLTSLGFQEERLSSKAKRVLCFKEHLELLEE